VGATVDDDQFIGRLKRKRKRKTQKEKPIQTIQKKI